MHKLEQKRHDTTHRNMVTLRKVGTNL